MPSDHTHLTSVLSYENLLKTDLEVALEEHLRANQSSLSKNPQLEPYYRKIGAGSPVKRETSSALVATGGGGSGGGNEKPVRRARRQTRGRIEESDAPYVPLNKTRQAQPK